MPSPSRASSPPSDDTAAGTAGKTAATADLMTGLRARIRSGQYPVGTWLPAERDLVDEFGVARRVVRRAIARLAEEGLVVCRPRCRPVVETPPRPASDLPPSLPAVGGRLVALVMWHGDPKETGATAQQRVFWGMNQRLARDGFHGVFLDLGEAVGSEEENAEREAAHLRYAQEQGFAGVVFYAYAYRRNRELIREVGRRLPLILIDRMVPGVQADFVGTDNHRAMYEATRHLIDLGHRHILFVTTGEPINTVQDRCAGYRSALAEASASGERPPLPELVLTAPPDGGASEWPVFESLMRLDPGRRPTAILCVNDHVAVNVYRQLRAEGLRIPEDVSLCGFDDVIALLPDGVGLTTVAQPFEEIGRAAAETFLARYRGPEGAGASAAPDVVELPARLVARASTVAAAVSALAELSPAASSLALVPGRA